MCNVATYVASVQTFMVVARDKTMFRFTATKALFVLSPTNIVRRKAILLLCHPYPLCHSAVSALLLVMLIIFLYRYSNNLVYAVAIVVLKRKFVFCSRRMNFCCSILNRQDDMARKPISILWIYGAEITDIYMTESVIVKATSSLYNSYIAADDVRVCSLNVSNVFQPVGHVGDSRQLCLHGDQPGNADLGVSTAHSASPSILACDTNNRLSSGKSTVL